MESLKVKWSRYRQRLFEERAGDDETFRWLGGVVPVALLIIVALFLSLMFQPQTGVVLLGGALFIYQHVGGRRQAELLARIDQLEADLKAARMSANQAPERG